MPMVSAREKRYAATWKLEISEIKEELASKHTIPAIECWWYPKLLGVGKPIEDGPRRGI
jgi:hypothetical protein